MHIELHTLIDWATYFVVGSIVLRMFLPPKELVWQYWPKAKWYGFVIDVLSRWASLDLRAKVWNIKKHVDKLKEKEKNSK